MPGVEVGLNGTDVGGDDSGGPVAAVLDASYTADGRSLERGVGVRTDGVVGKAGASGLSAVLAG